jgi:hypothetical protein
VAHAASPRGMEERAKELARSLWNEEPELVVDSAMRKEIDGVVAHAAAHLPA